MKPFDLEEYLKNPHLNIVTRSGNPVRIVCTDKKTGMADRPIIALVKIDDDNEIAIICTKEGIYDRNQDSDYDLFFSTIKKEGYVRVWDGIDGTRCVGADVYDTYEEAKNAAEEAKNAAVNDYIAIAKIEWEE